MSSAHTYSCGSAEARAAEVASAAQRKEVELRKQEEAARAARATAASAAAALASREAAVRRAEVAVEARATEALAAMRSEAAANAQRAERAAADLAAASARLAAVDGDREAAFKRADTAEQAVAALRAALERLGGEISRERAAAAGAAAEARAAGAATSAAQRARDEAMAELAAARSAILGAESRTHAVDDTARSLREQLAAASARVAAADAGLAAARSDAAAVRASATREAEGVREELRVAREQAAATAASAREELRGVREAAATAAAASREDAAAAAAVAREQVAAAAAAIRAAEIDARERALAVREASVRPATVVPSHEPPGTAGVPDGDHHGARVDDSRVGIPAHLFARHGPGGPGALVVVDTDGGGEAPADASTGDAAGARNGGSKLTLSALSVGSSRGASATGVHSGLGTQIVELLRVLSAARDADLRELERIEGSVAGTPEAAAGGSVMREAVRRLRASFEENASAAEGFASRVRTLHARLVAVRDLAARAGGARGGDAADSARAVVAADECETALRALLIDVEELGARQHEWKSTLDTLADVARTHMRRRASPARTRGVNTGRGGANSGGGDAEAAVRAVVPDESLDSARAVWQQVGVRGASLSSTRTPPRGPHDYVEAHDVVDPPRIPARSPAGGVTGDDNASSWNEALGLLSVDASDVNDTSATPARAVVPDRESRAVEALAPVVVPWVAPAPREGALRADDPRSRDGGGAAGRGPPLGGALGEAELMSVWRAKRDEKVRRASELQRVLRAPSSSGMPPAVRKQKEQELAALRESIAVDDQLLSHSPTSN